MALSADPSSVGGWSRSTPPDTQPPFNVEAERAHLEAAIARAWARVEAANRAESDPAARELIEEADAEVARLAGARDRRLRSLEAAAVLAVRAGAGAGAPGSERWAEHAHAEADDVVDLVADELAGHEPGRPSRRFPLDTADLIH